jgi:geranylgeranyl diphosphate synthase type II
MSPAELAARLAPVEAALAARFGQVWPASFQAPLRYPLETGGKRVRPAICLAAAEAVGADPACAVPAAAALELVHTYSLVHDDLPCMDDDDLRRGRPTVHRAYDEATAVLVGDALLTEAFAVLAAAPLPADRVVALVARLARAAGPDGMVGGQAADVGATTGAVTVSDVDTLARLHGLKTGALLAAAAVMGGLSAGAPPSALAALEAYGQAVGLAFQLADDVLDAEQDSDAAGPPSYVKLLGVAETARRARALADAACAAVTPLPAPAALVALARFTVDRTV